MFGQAPVTTVDQRLMSHPIRKGTNWAADTRLIAPDASYLFRGVQ